LPVDEIFHRVTGLGCPHVVVTGGEPMLHAELVPLCESFRSARLHTTIETAGTLYLPVACDLMSISPKRANSRPPAARDPYWHVRHERARHVPKVIRQLMAEYDYQFKFVVDELEDCADVLAYLREFPEIDPNRVMLMPQGTDPAVLTDRAEWLVPFCRDHGLTFCPRKHIEWFGFVRGS
jgi:7-carboxy-7-deazaguanine synthase